MIEPPSPSEAVPKRYLASKAQVRQVLIFTGLYLFVAAIFIFSQKNYEFIINLFLMVIIIVATGKVYERAGLTASLLWNFSVWGLLHMLGGLIPIPEGWNLPDTSRVLYNWQIVPDGLKYDQVVHGYGVGLVTWLCWQGLVARVRSHDASRLKPTLGILGVCATAGMGFGSFNEVVEFFAVLILPVTNVGDYHNTGWDLVANLVGAVLAAAIIGVVDRKRYGPVKMV